MAEPRSCPNCGLLNPPDSRRCDCGYDFADQQVVRQAGRQVDPAWFGSVTVLACMTLGVVLGIIAIFIIAAAEPGPTSGEGLYYGAVFGAVVGLLVGAVVGLVIVLLRQWFRR